MYFAKLTDYIVFLYEHNKLQSRVAALVKPNTPPNNNKSIEVLGEAISAAIFDIVAAQGVNINHEQLHQIIDGALGSHMLINYKDERGQVFLQRAFVIYFNSVTKTLPKINFNSINEIDIEYLWPYFILALYAVKQVLIENV